MVSFDCTSSSEDELSWVYSEGWRRHFSRYLPSVCLRLVANKCSSCLAQFSTWRPASFAPGSYGWTVTNLELAVKWEISALPSICLDRRPASRRFPWCLLVCPLLGCIGYMYSLGTEKLPSRHFVFSLSITHDWWWFLFEDFTLLINSYRFSKLHGILQQEVHHVHGSSRFALLDSHHHFFEFKALMTL